MTLWGGFFNLTMPDGGYIRIRSHLRGDNLDDLMLWYVASDMYVAKAKLDELKTRFVGRPYSEFVDYMEHPTA